MFSLCYCMFRLRNMFRLMYTFPIGMIFDVVMARVLIFQVLMFKKDVTESDVGRLEGN